MSRQFKLVALLLPLFIARSLLPIGFMLSFDEGGARLVFCPSEISSPSSPSADPHAAHSGHHAHGQHHAHHHGADDSDVNSADASHQSCPFAFAAAAPLVSIQTFSPQPPVSEAIAEPRDSAILIFASRAHPIRGPPAVS